MRRAFFIGLSGIAAVIVVAFIALFALGWPDRQYAAAFEKIELGSTRDKVVGQLGEPSVTTTDCHVAQFVRFQNPPGWTDRPAAAYCGHWIGPGGAGQFYAVAFSSENRVVGIAYGDS